jgi:hypothetical protein
LRLDFATQAPCERPLLIRWEILRLCPALPGRQQEFEEQPTGLRILVVEVHSRQLLDSMDFEEDVHVHEHANVYVDENRDR